MTPDDLIYSLDDYKVTLNLIASISADPLYAKAYDELAESGKYPMSNGEAFWSWELVAHDLPKVTHTYRLYVLPAGSNTVLTVHVSLADAFREAANAIVTHERTTETSS